MKVQITFIVSLFLLVTMLAGCKENEQKSVSEDYIVLDKATLKDKIKGAWALQTIGVTYGGPTEFRYNQKIIPDSVTIQWSDTMMRYWMENIPGLYDDIYLDLTFVETIEKYGVDAPSDSFAKAYAYADYKLWHANQQGRYNYRHGIKPPQSGHWLNNPHADDIDFQIEADFAGIMNPGMPNSAVQICDTVGHIMNHGDGYYGGVFVAGMYSFAFINDSIADVIHQALSLIPEQSTFYQCIADVIKWHKEYPDEWKKNWQLIEDKWGVDIGCPDGAFRPFNIDAKINSAYVVLGLLYGNGDLDKTLEISTRAGQDSDCNPATAAAVLGTIMGYENIPEYWGKGLEYIEDMDFKYTSMSLNDAYEISYKHALEQIKINNGKVTENEVKIKKQKPLTVALEENFPGYKLGENIPVNKTIKINDPSEVEIEFEGIGVVVRGGARYVKIEPENESMDDFVLNVECYIDDELSKTMELPLNFIHRSPQVFFQYELPEGKHKLKLKVLNPHKRASLEIKNIITYTK